jgi:hypothetical protein
MIDEWWDKRIIKYTYTTQQIGLHEEDVEVVISDRQELQVKRIGSFENTFGKTTIPEPPVKSQVTMSQNTLSELII